MILLFPKPVVFAKIKDYISGERRKNSLVQSGESGLDSESYDFT